MGIIDPTAARFIGIVDDLRMTDPLIGRGGWRGYKSNSDAAGPMRGAYTLVRWTRPTIAVSHDSSTEVIRLAQVIEEAIA